MGHIREHGEKSDAAPDGAVMTAIVGVMSKLKAVIEEENDLLHRGLPATLLETAKTKGDLTTEYSQLSVKLSEGGPSTSDVIKDPELCDMLIEAGAALYALSEENRKLLSGALMATRRRVNAVMEAVRACEKESGPTNAPKK